MEFLQNIFTRIKDWFKGIWEKTEKRDRLRFLVISGIAVTLLIAALVMLNGSRYEEVFSSDDTQTLRSSAAVLSENGISSKISGSSLLVDKKNKDTATGLLWQSSTGGVELDYSLYQQAMGLTATDSDRRMMAKFELQENLKRVLESYPMVVNASVMIDIPDNKGLYVGELKGTTASVALTLENPSDFTREQANNIAGSIAHALNTSPENVFITDQNMRKLNVQDSDDSAYTLLEYYTFQKQVEEDLSNAVNRQLALMFGGSHADAQVNLLLDFDDYTSDSITFLPVVGDDEGIVRSRQIMEEYAKGNGWYNGEPGTDENGLGEDYAEVDTSTASEWQKNQETINNEINQINETLVRAKGSVKSVTVSVLVDTNGLIDTSANTEAVQAAVGAILGLQPSQYANNVIVNYVSLEGPKIAQADQDAYDAKVARDRLYELIQTIVLYLVVGICVIMLIMRTYAFLKPKEIELPQEYLAGDLGNYGELIEAAAQSAELEITKTPSRERVEEFIENNPEAVANMLRAWLQEEEERSW